MRYTKSKNKLARREGIDLGMKTTGSKAQANLLKRINVRPGQHGARMRRKVSERGRQLQEKQKLRYLFGLTETQLKKYFTRAKTKKGNTALFLSQALEGRLDNFLYRAGMTPTRAAARQLVGHGHVTVNGKRVTIPSFALKPTYEVAFAREASLKIPYVDTAITNKDTIMPKWVGREGAMGKLLEEPTQEEVEKQVDLRSVIEFYSR